MNDPATTILSAATLTAFTIAVVRDIRRREPRIDGLLVWVASGLVGIAVSFIAAVLLGEADWRMVAVRGLGFAAAAVGAVGVKKAMTERAPAAEPPEADDTLGGMVVPATPENAGAPRAEISGDWGPR